MRFLLTQGSAHNTIAAAQYLWKAGHSVGCTFHKGSRVPYCKFSRAIARNYEIDEGDAEGFVEGIRAIQKKDGYEVLIPMGHPVTFHAAEHREVLEGIIPMACPTLAQHAVAVDKLASHHAALAAGLTTPGTCLANEERFGGKAWQQSWPLFVKGRYEGTHKGKLYRCNDQVELAKALDHTKEDPENWIIQEYVEGEGCGYFTVAKDGDPMGEFMHHRIREFPPSGGVSCCAEAYSHENLREAGRALLAHLKWTGPAMVEFRHDGRGGFHFIELNAKFWGSLELSLRCGINFPEICGLTVRGARPNPQPSSSKRFQWPWTDFQHVRQRPGAFWAVMKDFLNPGVAKNFHWRDPMPFVLMGLKSVRHLIRG